MAINDVCFLPQAVKEEIFARAREYINEGIIPHDVDRWIADNLRKKGYRENKDYVSWTPGTYKIVKS